MIAARASTTSGSTPPGSSGSPSGSRPSPPPWPRSGLDPATDWLPVAPAAHYLCGGIVADLDGASSLPGLWAAGEAACNGVHGRQPAGLQLAARRHGVRPRVVEAIERGPRRPPRRAPCARAWSAATAACAAARRRPTGRRGGGRRPWRRPHGPTGPTGATADPSRRGALQRTMTAHAGVLRSAESLAARGGARGSLARGRDAPAPSCGTSDRRRFAGAAAGPEESRGAHTRPTSPAADGPAARCFIAGRVPDPTRRPVVR